MAATDTAREARCGAAGGLEAESAALARQRRAKERAEALRRPERAPGALWHHGRRHARRQSRRGLVERRRWRWIGARSARGLLQSGQRRRQQHQHVTGVRGSGQKRSDSQGERHARSGIIMTAARASTAIETLDGVATAAAAERRVKRDEEAAGGLEADAAAQARVRRARKRAEALGRPARAPCALWHHHHHRARRQSRGDPRREAAAAARSTRGAREGC